MLKRVFGNKRSAKAQINLCTDLDTTDCLNGEQRPDAHAQVDLNLHILCMLEGLCVVYMLNFSKWKKIKQ